MNNPIPNFRLTHSFTLYFDNKQILIPQFRKIKKSLKEPVKDAKTNQTRIIS